MPRVRFRVSELASQLAADRVEAREAPFVHYLIYQKGESRPAAVAFSTLTVAPEVRGYGGPINLLMVLTRDGRIRRIRLVESRETPAYVRGLGPWLKRLQGRRAGEELQLGRDGVDTLSGATVTARAVVETVNRASRRAARTLLMLELPPRRAPPWWHHLGWETIFLLLSLPVAVLLFLKGGPTNRSAFLLIQVVVAGFWLNSQLALVNLVTILRSGLPPASQPELLVVAGGALLLAVLFGPIYCGYLCPFGALQEIGDHLGLTGTVDPMDHRRARWIRYGLASLSIVGVRLWGWGWPMRADPLQHLFGLTGSGAVWLVVACALLASLRFARFWCRYFCPVGALLALLGRPALLLRLVPTRRYGECDLGVDGPDDLGCIQCNRCVRGRLRFRAGAENMAKPGFDPGRERRLFWGAVLVTLVALVAAARSSAPVEKPVAGGLGKVRSVNQARIKRQIQEGRLSGKRAMWWRKVGR